MERKTYILAVSGVKNSGKTTLITRILPLLTSRGLKVATVKHDGHEFEADVPGTDTYRHLQAGAYGTVVFSDTKYMLVKRQEQVQAEQLIAMFSEADLILLEGFKYSTYPKLELIRSGNSGRSVCSRQYLEALVTDLPAEVVEPQARIPVLDLNRPEEVAEFIYERWLHSGAVSERRGEE